MDLEVDAEAPRVVFIGGTGRSGTSITRTILSRHPAVGALPFEYRFIIDPDGIVDFYCSYSGAWSPFIADKRIARLERLLLELSRESTVDRLVAAGLRIYPSNPRVFSPRRYSGWELEKHLPGFHMKVEQLIERLYDFSYSAYWVGTSSYSRRPTLRHAGPKGREELRTILGNFVGSVIGGFLNTNHKQVFVEDNTWNILFAKELLELVPNAKIVHVVRDPRDVVTSFMKERWCPDDAREASWYYCSLIDRWMEVREAIPEDQYHELSLEALVQDTVTTVTDLCSFIDIPMDVTLLEQDLSKSNTGRWRRDLSPDDQAIVQQIVGNRLMLLGYSGMSE